MGSGLEGALRRGQGNRSEGSGPWKVPDDPRRKLGDRREELPGPTSPRRDTRIPDTRAGFPCADGEQVARKWLQCTRRFGIGGQVKQILIEGQAMARKGMLFWFVDSTKNCSGVPPQLMTVSNQTSLETHRKLS